MGRDRLSHLLFTVSCLGALAALAACSGPTPTEQTGLSASQRAVLADLDDDRGPGQQSVERTSIFDLFDNTNDPNTTLEVNRYIWNAALEVLNFMPIQTVDPFSGVIVTGFGAPPGGGTAYRATVLVRDPALDARSLNVALATRSGPASQETIRAVEDAILTRARQLRAQDSTL